MSMSTGLSRITGFVRVWATAYALGVTALAASYHVANNIPNMLYELVAGGIISSLFIPIFMERLKQYGEEDAWKYASYLFNITVLALGAAAALAIFFAEQVVWTQTFRTDAQDAALIVFFFQIFAIQVAFYGAGAVISGLLNAHRRFLWPALGPAFNNLTVIATLIAYTQIVSVDPTAAKWTLAIGTTLGVLVMFGVQLPSLIALRPKYTWRIDLSHPGLKAMGKMALPTVIYVITNIVAVSFRNAYALDVAADGPATLSYAWMFYQLPYGILAVALATAFFTELSDAAGRQDLEEFRTRFTTGIRATAMLILPASALLIALAHPLITLYRAGKFTAEDVPQVAAVLQWWASGLFFFASFMFVLKTFYSLKDTRTPMLTNLGLTVVHVGLYAVLTTGALGFAGIGLVGIPISDAVFYAMSAILLAYLLRRKIGNFGAGTVVKTIVKIAIAAAIGGGAAFGVAQAFPNPDALPKIALATVLAGGITGLAVTWGAARLLRVQELSYGEELVRKGLSKIGRQKRSSKQ
ncbi:MAG: murein biosynthesis integral membrane protein MurJ [Actinobacteria bacterium]|nr:murein biosynthesis integral membrane protein MurJ [Actinomycetota bacterium]